MNTDDFVIMSSKDFVEFIRSTVKAEIDLLKKDFQPKEPTDYMTREEVKNFLKVDLSTLWHWTKRGKLQAYGIGNRVYYKRCEVERAIIPLNHK